MTEMIVDEERYLNVVPAHLREVGVLTEPLTIAEKALAQIWQVQQRLPWGCPPLMEELMPHRVSDVTMMMMRREQIAKQKPPMPQR